MHTGATMADSEHSKNTQDMAGDMSQYSPDINKTGTSPLMTSRPRDDIRSATPVVKMSLKPVAMNYTPSRRSPDTPSRKRPLSESDTTGDIPLPELNFEHLATSCPEEVHPWIRDMLLLIGKSGVSNSSSVSDLESRVAILEDVTENDGRDISSLNETVQALTISNKILTGRLIHTETKLDHVLQEMTDIKNRSMRDNIIIRSKGAKYKPTRDENTSQKVKMFLNDEMKVPDSNNIIMPRAHRMGQSFGDYNRMMIAKVPHEEDMRKIFNNASALKNTDFSISRQCTPETEERKQFAWPKYKEARGREDRARFDHMGRLFINDVPQKQFEPTQLPPASDGLVSKGLKTPMIAGSDTAYINDHEFRAWAARASSLQDVRETFDYLLLTGCITEADHVPHAFRFKDITGELCENFNSDREGFSGLQILKKTRAKNAEDVCVFVGRVKSAQPLTTKLKNTMLDQVVAGALLALEGITKK